MSEMRIDFSGRNGLIALSVVIGVLILRIATLGTTNDPKLEAAVRAELQNELGNQLGKVLDDVDVTDAESVATVLEHSDADNIRVHSMAVSKPLLSFSSSADAVVKVEYSLPGVSRRSEYWGFKHSTLGGWRYRRPSTAISYYLNFF